MRRSLVLRVLLPLTVAGAGACHAPVSLPKSAIARQQVLGERILVALAKARGGSPAATADLALAVSALKVPAQVPRLRLLVAGDDALLAAGAAIALCGIEARDGGKSGLADLARTDTNPFVREACRQELSHTAPALSEGLPPHPELIAPLFRRRSGDVLPLIESGSAEHRREGLRLLLTGPDRPGNLRLDGDIVHALSDSDRRVALLASAVLLERSLASSPPPADAAVPDARLR